MAEMEKLSLVAKALTPSPIQQLSYLAQRYNAINLAEGFPDFPAPPHIKNAAVSAINSDFNQYRHVQGICDHVARKMKEMHGLDVDPLTDIVICCGQSEAFAATMFAIVDQGDEVIIFDPSYETYETCIRLAGGVPVHVALEPPNWTLNLDKLKKSFTVKTKAIVLNSPHNPTGKVFTKDELEIIAGACQTWNILAITDEVYEHITFDKESHISLASLPEMQKRTIVTSSLSKTFSVTGWRIGWAIAPAWIASAVRNIHIRITDSAPAPFQEAALTALSSPPAYFDSLRSDYESKRDCAVNMLAEVGFKMQFKPKGSFFVFAPLPENCTLSDVEFVEELIKQAGVVAVPGCGFFHTTLCEENSSPAALSYQRRYIRFAFCKSEDTLAAASRKLSKLVDDGRGIK
ncbi:Pyridoxal phosphate (PLP)-dependent transferase superfamily protein [Forsythia ovata]|uniref:Pyridoxal phosphate (PLP)-dependent transferase superfamily protein n=1 Tax=Forsythia ovata TaxID=205694 RepID=A0ABD1X424_9LAMI